MTASRGRLRGQGPRDKLGNGALARPWASGGNVDGARRGSVAFGYTDVTTGVFAGVGRRDPPLAVATAHTPSSHKKKFVSLGSLAEIHNITKSHNTIPFLLRFLSE